MNYQALIEKYYPEDDALRQLLITHSQSVAQFALQIVSLHPELGIDRQFVLEAAMLHDIGIRPCRETRCKPLPALHVAPPEERRGKAAREPLPAHAQNRGNVRTRSLLERLDHGEHERALARIALSVARDKREHRIALECADHAQELARHEAVAWQEPLDIVSRSRLLQVAEARCRILSLQQDDDLVRLLAAEKARQLARKRILCQRQD